MHEQPTQDEIRRGATAHKLIPFPTSIAAATRQDVVSDLWEPSVRVLKATPRPSDQGRGQ